MSIRSRLAARRSTIVYVIAAGVALPVAAAGVLVWGLADRTSSLDRVPVAIVNQDKIVTGDHPTAAGRELSAALVDPSSSDDDNLDWTLTDASDAKAGLKSGEYYSVLTIPSDFSQSVLSSGTDKPVQAELTLQSNQASSMTAGIISQEVADTAATALGTQVTQGFLNNVFIGFNDEATSLGNAASNADKLAGGTAQLADGADKLNSGSRSLASSGSQLSSGAAQLAASAGQAASGVSSVATGSKQLAASANSAADGADKLAGGAKSLDSSARQVSGGAAEVSSGVAGLHSSAANLATGAQTAAGLAGNVAGDLDGLAAQCSAASRAPQFCAQLGQLDQLAHGSATAAQSVSAGAGALPDATQKLADASGGVASGATQLASGAGNLSDSAGSLAEGQVALAAAAGQLADGAGTAAGGVAQVDSGAGQLATGAAQVASAAQQAASGSDSLASSAASVDSGAHSLSSALDSGAKKAPSYSSGQQSALKKVVSQPVVLHASSSNDRISDGWLIAAITGIVLWLGALAGLLLSRRRSRDELLAPVSSARLLVSELAPLAALVLAQTAVMLTTLLSFHLDLANVAGYIGFAALGAVSFAAIGSGLRAVGGRVGLLAFLGLLLVQGAAIGNILPIQTAPQSLQFLAGLLPLNAFIDGASQLASGGATVSMASACAVLAVWGLVALAALAIAGRRRRAAIPGRFAIARASVAS